MCLWAIYMKTLSHRFNEAEMVYAVSSYCQMERGFGITIFQMATTLTLC